MSKSDWYARKLAQVQGAPARTQPVGTPPPPPAPSVQQAVVSQQQTVAAPPSDEEPSLTKYLRGEYEIKGAVATRTEQQACPSCGSRYYFSNSAGAVINPGTGQQNVPAPKCYECGYNGKWAQGEMGGNWGA